MKIKNDVITLDSKKPGKNVTIIAGIHGNEICGLKAFAEIIPKLKITSGKVNFVYGNPKAIEKNVRQIDVNLNRIFKANSKLTKNEKKSYEYSRAKKLKKILDQSDALLDIHSSRNKNSVPFIITDKKNFPIAKKLPFKIKSSGWDKIEAGGTDDYMNKQNKINICVECGYNLDPKAVNKAKVAIKKFLKLTNNLRNNRTLHQYRQKTINAYYVYHTKSDNFKLKKKFKDFEKIKKGTIIGTDKNKKITVSKNSYIVFARDCQQSDSEAFVLCK